MRFYNADMVPDNEFGALDNQTLKVLEAAKAAEDEEARRSKLTTSQRANEDIIASLKDQAAAQRALAEAIQAQKDAQAAYEAAQKAKADAEEAARKKAEEEARKKAEEEARKRAANKKLYDGGIGFSTSLIDTPTTPTPTPPSTPPKPLAPPPPPPPPPKTAPIDTVLIDQEAVDIEIMQDLIWEDIGGHELINIARNDIVNGQTVSYQPIKNLTTINQQYNPNNIVSLQNTSDKYFANFSIKLETKTLEEGEGSGPDGAYVYIEDATGDLIVELINLEPDEQIEVQISLSGTIYEAEFNES